MELKHEGPVAKAETPAPRRRALLTAPGGITPPAEDERLGEHPVPVGQGPRLWWLGVHGGAGETTLAALLPGSRAAGHLWPRHSPPDPPAPVVLVARSSATGLRAAQLAARDWASGARPVQLLGLVVIADAPGRRPPVLADYEQVIAGAVPALWQIEWHEPWRLGEPVTPESAPHAMRAVLDAILQATAPGATVKASHSSSLNPGRSTTC